MTKIRTASETARAALDKRAALDNGAALDDVDTMPALNLHPIGKRSARTVAKSLTRASEVQKGSQGKFVKDVITGDFTEHFTYERVPVDRLLIDPLYQRALKPEWASKLAHNWVEDKNLPFIVSLRENGNYYVLDGQQRHGALQLMVNPPETVYAKVFRNLTIEQEADIYTSGGTDRVNLTVADLFKSALVAKTPWAISLNNAALESGYNAVRNFPGPHNLTAISAARTILERRGETFLIRVLRVTHDSWPIADNSGRSSILFGLEIFFNRYPMANDKRLIQQLKYLFETPRDLEHTAHGYAKQFKKGIHQAVGYATYDAFNKNLRNNRLPDWTW